MGALSLNTSSLTKEEDESLRMICSRLEFQDESFEIIVSSCMYIYTHLYVYTKCTYKYMYNIGVRLVIIKQVW